MFILFQPLLVLQVLFFNFSFLQKVRRRISLSCDELIENVQIFTSIGGKRKRVMQVTEAFYSAADKAKKLLR